MMHLMHLIYNSPAGSGRWRLARCIKMVLRCYRAHSGGVRQSLNGSDRGAFQEHPQNDNSSLAFNASLVGVGWTRFEKRPLPSEAPGPLLAVRCRSKAARRTLGAFDNPSLNPTTLGTSESRIELPDAIRVFSGPG